MARPHPPETTQGNLIHSVEDSSRAHQAQPGAGGRRVLLPYTVYKAPGWCWAEGIGSKPKHHLSPVNEPARGDSLSKAR